MKKIITMILLLTMVIGTLPAYGDSTVDTPSSWAKEPVEFAIAKGYVPEHLQGDYQASITREEFAELFVTAVFAERSAMYERSPLGPRKYTGFGDEFDLDDFLSRVSTTESFTDTDNKYIKVANMLGMVNGVGEGKFNPNGLITREQASIMFVNYFQTLTSPIGADAYETLADLDESSTWAKNAVVWAYGAGFLNGTKPYTENEDNWGRPNKDGLFSPKATFTREQAITVISRLGGESGRNNYLDKLILRGYAHIGSDSLGSYWEIDGDTVKMKARGKDYITSGVKTFFSTQTRFKHYVDKHTTEELIAVTAAIPTDIGIFSDTYHYDRVLSGEETLYDYGAFTLEHNVDGYLAVMTKTPGYGYMACTGSSIFVEVEKDGIMEIVTVIGVEVK